MAGTRAQQFEILSDKTFLDQLAGSLMTAAINVLNEADTTQNHVNRLKYAQLVFDSGLFQARNAVGLVMGNPTMAANAGNPPGGSGTPFPDGDVDFVVASLWDQLANKFAV